MPTRPADPPADLVVASAPSPRGSAWPWRALLARPWIGSLALLVLFVAGWHLATASGGGGEGAMDPEYAKLMGGPPQAAIPGPWAVAVRAGTLLRYAFDRGGAGGLGIGWHLLASLGRVMLGYALAVAVALPAGFAIGLLPPLHRALDPFIQVLRPISPLAWMPLALYTLRDSSASAIFIIFICSLWPMLTSTAAGAAGVRRDWLDVSRVLGLPWHTKVLRIVLPAAVPLILSGMRVSIGIAWFVIVAAEMVVGSNGIGYFIWNEWNNLQIASMLVAVLLIGCVGLGLDQALGWAGRRMSFRE
jgi:nitrate/nitrite transport system permease protein